MTTGPVRFLQMDSPQSPKTSATSTTAIGSSLVSKSRRTAVGFCARTTQTAILPSSTLVMRVTFQTLSKSGPHTVPKESFPTRLPRSSIWTETDATTTTRTTPPTTLTAHTTAALKRQTCSTETKRSGGCTTTAVTCTLRPMPAPWALRFAHRRLPLRRTTRSTT